MSTFHTYCECGAIGDTAFNICRTLTAMEALGHKSAIIHTSPYLLIDQYDYTQKIDISNEVLEIWNQCSFVSKVEIDVNLSDGKSIYFSDKYQAKIEQPMFTRPNNNILDWIDLKKYLPELNTNKKIAVFQPISLQNKPVRFHADYIQEWNRCLKNLIKNKYHIVMIGGIDDDFRLCFDANFLNEIDNKIGKWNILESLSFLIYRSEIVLSCDSWAAVWGVATRKKTFVSLGYKMEFGKDLWAYDFLGNKDCYELGWTSQGKFCDAFLAEAIRKFNQ